MSRLSLIVTSFDVGPWIEAALQGAARVLRPGDELIVVDDASRDDSSTRIRAFGQSGQLAPGVAFRPVLLGRNTPGGVGPAANIGMSLAQGEILAFLDGDDWLDPEGFDVVRDRFEEALSGPAPLDLLIANYTEWHEGLNAPRLPADAGLWHGVETLADEDARSRALEMIAVPWRKLYRRDFIETHGLRFPEGDFFFEDNPFHWAVCRAAIRIAFHDRVLCRHRIARPGQTMASSGPELLAFFTHFRTIMAGIGRREYHARVLALRWLAQNMCWHMERMRLDTIIPWIDAAREALADVPARLWRREVLPHYDAWAREILQAIREDRLDLAERRIMAIACARNARQAEQQFQSLQGEIDRLRADLAEIQGNATATDPDETDRLLQEFERLRHASGPAA
ncbi:glycosyltransferase family 2 protein [Limimaricola sp. ASW11-118]|uniref:Glycosyltransferase family 2 protein n=1 Tax=Limimaricola litoreus TaxID=2955316 RepID=A0A9X2JT48_9RHOB|nr:glycosyltransferase family A protein [Limimaricola litoreus]MCP1170386.1 glycosyltransferase family 2 protein [Limimaricola litoreus]